MVITVATRCRPLVVTAVYVTCCGMLTGWREHCGPAKAYQPQHDTAVSTPQSRQRQAPPSPPQAPPGERRAHASACAGVVWRLWQLWWLYLRPWGRGGGCPFLPPLYPPSSPSQRLSN